MRVSKDKVNQHLKAEVFRTLHQLFADIKDPQEVKEVLSSFLSEAEHTTIAKRVAIAYWLDKGRGYDNIKNNLKVSSATIASVQSTLEKTGVKAALSRMKAEEWANVWAARIKKLVR